MMPLEAELVFGKVSFLMPKWCKMVSELAMACTPRIYIKFLHSLTIYDICACYAWLELEMGRVCGQRSKIATFGGIQL